MNARRCPHYSNTARLVGAALLLITTVAVPHSLAQVLDPNAAEVASIATESDPNTPIIKTAAAESDPNAPVITSITTEAGGAELPEVVVVDSRELRDYRDAIFAAESSRGAYATLLPEQLLSLGLALQKDGHHADAVDVFKRGAHLARINDGLYGVAQIRHLQNKITSHLVLGEWEEADKSQARLFRVQRRNTGNEEIQIQALLQQALWQQQAYKLNIGGDELSFGRLMSMWDLNRLALTSIIEREGDKSPQLLLPLYGMLRAQYLISGHRDRSTKTSSDFKSEVGSRQAHHRFNSYFSKSYDMGSSIIRAIYDIQASRHGEQSLPTIKTRIMLGDWMLWHGVRDPAMSTYVLAIGELAELDDAQLQAQSLLSVPAALPDLDGVRPLPPEVSAEVGDFLVEFGVTRRGRVVDLVRLQEPDDENTSAAVATQTSRLMRALRKTKFRPRFVDGEAATTEKVVKAYAIAH